MTRINLLPWRETLHKEKQRQFAAAAIVAVIFTGIIFLGVHLVFEGRIQAQTARNDYIKKEIAGVEKQIQEIKLLEAEKANLLSRMNVIQELQSKRPEIVHLFYELMDNVPSGVYLTAVKQKNSSLIIEGIAQSNARVSAFMRNLAESDWLEEPILDVIEAKKKKGLARTSKFKLHVEQTQKNQPEEQG